MFPPGLQSSLRPESSLDPFGAEDAWQRSSNIITRCAHLKMPIVQEHLRPGDGFEKNSRGRVRHLHLIEWNRWGIAIFNLQEQSRRLWSRMNGKGQRKRSPLILSCP